MAHLLGAEAVHLEFPTKVVFDSVTIGINEGDRIGIVGRNGDGKSSLLKVLAQRLEPDSGRVTWRNGVHVGVLDQTDTLDQDDTVGHAIVGDAADHEWASDPKIRDVLAGLVPDLDWDARVGDLSGGQRRRVALAKLLAGDWDVLALDEPTNHLDVEGITWLAQHLKRRWSANQGGLFVVTHDRWFLDEVCNLTWEVHDRIIEPFEGGYAAYILQRVERDRQASVVEAKRQNLMRKELAWLRRGAPARTSKPKFRIDAANQLIANEPPPRNPVELSQMATARLGKDVVDLIDAGFAYGDNEVLRDVTWRIAPGERTGILGVNGAGKSTLLKLVTGELSPTSGRVKHGKTVQVATLNQELEGLREVAQDRVSDVIARKRTTYVTGGKEMTPGQMLERLGFTNTQLATPVKDLSGGQQRRLQFLLLLLDEPNVLILDEPTNDLDTDMLAAMEDLLDTWPGTLLVISHDRYFLERVTDQQYAVLNGQMRHLPGGVDEYLALSAQVSAQRVGRGRSGGASSVAPHDSGSSRAHGVSDNAGGSSSGVSSADIRAAKKDLARIERRLAKIEEAEAKIHADMAAHATDYEKTAALDAQLRDLAVERDDLEMQWLEASEITG
ncbi:ABC-F family ATP-binding cassette domain-containing protein [Jonesia denitrificans]|nr:ABC-F family ATP-binding cassette domain-containing protein [Jonesia denitrificans]ASE09185.1 ABC transporter ATP-binding protein [Jonesia denitrificans]QXB43727.1 ABC-F family ATP-binding cassette domain-containing protein [Jonesia denitrificans]